MLKNNNQRAVNLIASRSRQNNRVRNLFAIAAVVLTTMMLTSVFTIMLSLGKNLNTAQLRLQGTCASIFLNQPTAEQIEAVRGMEYVKAVGSFIDIASVETESETESTIRVRWCDETEFEENLTPAIGEIHGYYPIASNEIMLSSAALSLLKITNPQLGMSIALPDSVEGLSGTTFVLSGWYQDFGALSGNAAAFVSAQYASSCGLSVAQDGFLSVSCKADKQNALYAQMEQLSLQPTQVLDVTFDVQSQNGSNMLVITVSIVLISLIIVLSGYLLIYNVLYISVIKDIRFYGMLKTIGTSPSQIRKIVTKQAFRFLILGVPIGIALGTLISFAGAPLASTMFSSSAGGNGILSTKITFNPLIYLGTILFSTLTVLLSCRKPAKIASRVSPMEALKYNGNSSHTVKQKKYAHGGKPHKMAFRNVFREKKRAVLVFASLFMGTMAFLSVNTFIGCLKFDRYVDVYLPNDYAIFTSNNGDADNTTYNASMQRLVEQMREINGLDYVEANRQTFVSLDFDQTLYQPFIDQLKTICPQNTVDEMIAQCESGEMDFETRVISVSARMLEMYNKKAHTEIDIDAFERGEVALLGTVSTDGAGDALLGKTITLTDTESGRQADITIGSVSSDENDYGLNIDNTYFVSPAPGYILVCDSVIDQLTDSPTIATILADCKSTANINAVDASVSGLIKSNRYVAGYDIKNEEMSSFHTSISSLNILTSSISIVLILIGVLNFVNVMLTGVYTRRKELAVLESVGMTKKQIRQMLMCEGMYYAVITILLILTAGNGLMYLVASLAQQIADYAVFYYPFGIMAGICAFILLTCLLVPTLVYRVASRESVTERLRDTK